MEHMISIMNNILVSVLEFMMTGRVGNILEYSIINQSNRILVLIFLFVCMFVTEEILYSITAVSDQGS